MFALSVEAAERIKRLTESSPGSWGIRVATRPRPAMNGDHPHVSVRIELAERPWATDEILVDKGVPVFVEPGLSGFLEDKRLEVDDSDGEETFTLASR
jgi:Fe-S cluster assembly iron-binding protein IscA